MDDIIKDLNVALSCIKKLNFCHNENIFTGIEGFF